MLADYIIPGFNDKRLEEGLEICTYTVFCPVSSLLQTSSLGLLLPNRKNLQNEPTLIKDISSYLENELAMKWSLIFSKFPALRLLKSQKINYDMRAVSTVAKKWNLNIIQISMKTKDFSDISRAILSKNVPEDLLDDYELHGGRERPATANPVLSE